MPILVTGAAGHLGANLVRKLIADGHSVRCLLRRNDDNSGILGRDALDALAVDVVYGDVRDHQAVARAVDGVDRVFHVAAMISTIAGDALHKREIFDTNVLGTRHVMEASLAAGVKRVVMTGSFSAVGYPLENPSFPNDETMPFYPYRRMMPYEQSKVLAEHELLRTVADGLDAVIATSTAIVGGNDFLPSRLGRTLCDFSNGKLKAYIYDGGIEFVTTRDVVEGHLLAMEHGRKGHRYILASEFLLLEEMLEHFVTVTGLDKPRLRLRADMMLGFAEVASAYLTRFRPNFPQRLTPGAIRLLRRRRHANTQKAQTELGFKPTPIIDAVREAYAFHYDRGAIVNPLAKTPVLQTVSTGNTLDFDSKRATNQHPRGIA